jgi:hypothetical protein
VHPAIPLQTIPDTGAASKQSNDSVLDRISRREIPRSFYANQRGWQMRDAPVIKLTIA